PLDPAGGGRPRHHHPGRADARRDEARASPPAQRSASRPPAGLGEVRAAAPLGSSPRPRSPPREGNAARPLRSTTLEPPPARRRARSATLEPDALPRPRPGGHARARAGPSTDRDGAHRITAARRGFRASADHPDRGLARSERTLRRKLSLAV